MYLLDTNVISQLDPRRSPHSANVSQWIVAHGGSIYLSAMTLAEMEAGVLKLRRNGSTARANEIASLIQAILRDFGDRILAMDAATAIEVAQLAERARPRVIELADLIIAATAKHHGLTLLTSNIRHFVGLGIRTVDPLVRLPAD